MRKFAKWLLATVCILCLAVLSVGCLEEVGDDSSSSVTHVHIAEDDWHSDGEYHWQLCAECGEEMNKGAHAFSALNVAVQPVKTAYTVGETFDKTGMKIEGECVCGNIEITDYTVAYQTENARAFNVNDDHVVINYGELFVNVSVTVGKIKLEKPVADATEFVYNGNEQTYTIAANERYTVSGNKETNAGTYTVTVALTDPDNVSWTDGSTDNLSYTFVIAKLAIENPLADTTTFVYNGNEQTYMIAENERYTVSGNKQTNAGTYTVTVALTDPDNVSWTDGSTDNLSYTFVIAKAENVIEWAKGEDNQYISLDIVYGETPAPQVIVKGGAVVTYTYYKAAWAEGQPVKAEKLDAWSATDCGAGLYCCVVTVAESDNYNSATTERFFNVFKAQNEITYQTNDNGEILSLDFVYGNGPIENTAMSKAGAITYTYTLVNSDSLGAPVEPAPDAVYSAWSDANISGIYMCKIFAEETDNYTSVTSYRWVRVHKAENVIEWAKGEDNQYISLDIVYGETPDPQVIVKGGAVVTYTYYKAAWAEGQLIKADRLDAWSATDCGAGLYCCVVTVAESDNYNSATTERFFNVFKAENEITYQTNDNGDILSLDFVYGNGPIENTAISKAGAITYTYTLVNSDSLGAPVEPASDAVYSVWSDANISGIYMCKIFAEETDNYTSVTSYRWVRVHKRETDENGVKYAYYENNEKTIQAYYVSGYNGTASEVNVLATFNDGVHGEKPVKYVGAAAFSENKTITKVILPESIESLEGSVFFGCSNLEFVSMVGVTNLDYVSPYGGERNNNFRNCNRLKYVIIGESLSSNCGQFNTEALPAALTLGLYVDGADGAVNLDGDNALWTGNIFYKGNASECGKWNYGADGEIVSTSHNFINGKCSNCGIYNTAGVKYAYNSEKEVYYVTGCDANVTEIIVLSAYSDGINPEKPVKYLATDAFKDNTTIKKVILPASVDSLEGRVFWGCENLEYVSMTGITNLECASPYGGEGRNNNFRNCFKLKTVIVSNALSSDVGQFGCGATDSGNKKILDFYVVGESGAPSLDYEAADANNLCSGKVYYYSETEASGCWHYDESGNAVLWN